MSDKAHFFYSDAWTEILNHSFGARVLKLCDDRGEYLLHSFPYKGFRVAIPTFPITISDRDLDSYLNSASLKSWVRSNGVHFLRVTGRENVISNAAIIQTQPKTKIHNLECWDFNKLSSSIRRNVRKFERNDFSIMDDAFEEEGAVAYGLYRGTISRHSGTEKYSLKYFEMLLSAARGRAGVHSIFAMNQENKPVGYMITVDHGGITYYLHGGIDFQYQNQRPMDSLFYRAIMASKARGMTGFDMLTSPRDQLNLVRYKEKWGGETSFVSTYTFAFNPVLNTGLRLVKDLFF